MFISAYTWMLLWLIALLEYSALIVGFCAFKDTSWKFHVQSFSLDQILLEAMQHDSYHVLFYDVNAPLH